MPEPQPRNRDALSFGPFSLVASERLLTRDGVPVELGARTLDTLIALVSRPNEVIGKRELMALVWPDVIVEEGSLRFHVASLRKALGDGEDGARYITTLAGRGYCFVAPVSGGGRGGTRTIDTADLPGLNLPNRLVRMIGREGGVAALAAQLTGLRLVSIVGGGGVGKTTVAIAVAHEMVEEFSAAVLFVDLGMLSDPYQIGTSIGSMLGLSVPADDPAAGLIAFLRDRRLLLILDNCEHLIEAAAVLAARLLAAVPQLHILATSRESLRVEGEHVHRLGPLPVPPDDPALPGSVALGFPAAQLFIERAAASGARLELTNANTAIVGDICRKLDGVPLAIELAAGRVETYGLQQTAELLDQRLALLWTGQRTAPPRQKTLQATLDWSYGLLSEPERVVLRRLAVFVGNFTLEAALAVVTGPGVDQAMVFSAIDSLVAKSMVATRPLGAMMRYRLLDTTRSYALDIPLEPAARGELPARHAAYYRRWLEQTGADWPTLSSAGERAPHLAALGNVRGALEWCFGPDGDAGIGISLAAAAAPVFLAMSLLVECHRWSARAVGALSAATSGGAEEMHLQTALGLSAMFTRGHSDAARAALERALEVAEARADRASQIQLLGRLHLFHLRIGDFNTALGYARRAVAVSSVVADPAATILSRSLLGISQSNMGEFDSARSELEAVIGHGSGARRTATLLTGIDPLNIAAGYLARTLWIQGYPDQAVARARLTLGDAADMGHPVTLSIALLCAISVSLWIGDLPRAEEQIEWSIAHAEAHCLTPYLATGRGFRGQLALGRGDVSAGVGHLQAGIEGLVAARYRILDTGFSISLAQGLAALGRFAEGLTLISETARRIEANGDFSYMPELLRVKGGLLLAAPRPSPSEAENCFTQALELSRRQTARGWELRTAIDLAALLTAQGNGTRARAALRPVFETFTEGSDTADLKAARSLLTTLG